MTNEEHKLQTAGNLVDELHTESKRESESKSARTHDSTYVWAEYRGETISSNIRVIVRKFQTSEYSKFCTRPFFFVFFVFLFF